MRAWPLFALCLGACGAPGPAAREPSSETPDPHAAFRALAPETLPAPPADPTNAFADSPTAATFGAQLFATPLFSGRLLEGDNDGSAGTLGHKGETGKVACQSCHVPEDGFSDTRSPNHQISLAAGWGRRRSPSLFDIGQAPLIMWDGRHDTLHGQVFSPFESAVEMNSSRLYVAQQVASHFRATYEAVFGDSLAAIAGLPPLSAEVTGCATFDRATNVGSDCHGVPGDGAEYDALSAEDKERVNRVVVNVGKAIAAFERRLTCGPSRFDAWVHGDDQALTESEQRGAELFVGAAGCVSCHSGPFLTDQKFHNVGLAPGLVAAAFRDDHDRGAAGGLAAAAADPFNASSAYSDTPTTRVPANLGPELEGAFRTPSLRCVAQRPSFMHTGQMMSLKAVVAFFDSGGHAGAYLGTKEIAPLGLSDAEEQDLVAFLKALGPDRGTGPTTPPTPTQSPPAGCGLPSAAFCDDFEEGPATNPARGGDLDPRRWSVSRLAPQNIADPELANPIRPAPIPACKGAPTTVLADRDSLICDATAEQSAQLLTAVGAQNYGLSSYRIRQPFDFAGRTGTLSFDVDAWTAGTLAGYVSVELTDEPIPTPSYTEANEHGPLPKNGLEIHFDYDGVGCAAYSGPGSVISVGAVRVYDDYVESTTQPQGQGGVCMRVQRGALNHIEVHISASHLNVTGSDVSTDGGKTFPPQQQLYDAPLALPFTRGWVHLTARNHAAAKYCHDCLGSAEGCGLCGVDQEAIVYHWDRVAFDGPVVAAARERDIADARVYTAPQNRGPGMYAGAYMSVGYRVPDTQTLTIDDVDVAHVTRARLALSSYYVNGFGAAADYATRGFAFRLNGHAWHDRLLTRGEIYVLELPGQTNLSQMVELPVGDLQAGNNTLEIKSVNNSTSWPLIVANLELVLDTD